jgi:hypothetical protein
MSVPFWSDKKLYNQNRMGFVFLQGEKNHLVFHIILIGSFSDDLQILNANADGDPQLMGIDDA